MKEAAEQCVGEALCSFLEEVWAWDPYTPQPRLAYSHLFRPTVGPAEKDKGDGKDPEVLLHSTFLLVGLL